MWPVDPDVKAKARAIAARAEADALDAFAASEPVRRHDAKPAWAKRATRKSPDAFASPPPQRFDLERPLPEHKRRRARFALT